MNVRALLRPARRLWPQKVRTRLTLIYATLFFTAGSALLGLTYGLLASSLPTQPPAAATVNSHELSNLIRECKSARFPPKRERLVPVPPNILPACKPAEAAYYAGTAAGLQAQRQRALSNLLVFSLAGLGVIRHMYGRYVRRQRMRDRERAADRLIDPADGHDHRRMAKVR